MGYFGSFMGYFRGIVACFFGYLALQVNVNDDHDSNNDITIIIVMAKDKNKSRSCFLVVIWLLLIWQR